MQDQRPLGINLGLALDDPQALTRWLGGDDALEPARAAVRYGEESAR